MTRQVKAKVAQPFAGKNPAVKGIPATGRTTQLQAKNPSIGKNPGTWGVPVMAQNYESGVYSTKEMFAEILRKLGELELRWENAHSALLARVDTLESFRDLQTQTNGIILNLERDFKGFERRFLLHENLDGHVVSLRRLVELETKVEALNIAEQTRKTLNEYIEAQRISSQNFRRWAFGLMITALLGILAIAVRVWFA
jgi:hypothetical protein